MAGEVISQEADDKAAHLAHFAVDGYSWGQARAISAVLLAF